MKQILILSGSPRVRGNSSLLADSFAEGARAAGHAVEKLLVPRLRVQGCKGCNACMRNGGACALRDDMAKVRKKMIAADAIVLATPIYYYSISSQLKAVIDRCYAFGHDQLREKTFYYLLTCAAPTEDYASTALATLDGFVSCCPECTCAGYVVGCDTHDAGDVSDAAKQQAYELGKGA